jgi:hypothetical protein
MCPLASVAMTPLLVEAKIWAWVIFGAMGSSLIEYWKRSFGFVTGIASVDWVLEILGSSLCAAGQMIESKRLGVHLMVSELKSGARFRIDQKLMHF